MEIRRTEEDNYEKVEEEELDEDEVVDSGPRRTGGVMLERFVEAADGDDVVSDGVTRTKSLTDEDLEELRGCLDLGYGFSYEEIPELCNTLPALELCYSMNQATSGSWTSNSSSSSSSSCCWSPRIGCALCLRVRRTF